jgi:hypothetical protein
MANCKVVTSETMATQSVNVDGYNYFVVDKDVSKGDRRSDGKLMAHFFAEEESATIINSVQCTTSGRYDANVVPMLCLVYDLFTHVPLLSSHTV